ncbi:MAG: histidine kinase [Chloroflexota bacterium]
MKHSTNRDLLSKWVQETYQLVNTHSNDVDLIIVDKDALIENYDYIEDRKSKTSPLFLPVMLITNNMTTQEQHTILELIDVIVESPVNITMFKQQLDVLLRTRDLSREVKVAKDAEHEQRLLAETLQETATILSSTLNTQEVFERILQNIGRLLPVHASAVCLIENGFARITQTLGYSSQEIAILNHFFDDYPIHDLPFLKQIIDEQQIIQLTPQSQFDITQQLDNFPIIIAPIILTDKTIGFILVKLSESLIADRLRQNHLMAFATQAAIAIQNARLYAQSQSIAVIQERERLARDFHDSVTQTLFSASVISESIRRSYGDAPDDLSNLLEELHLLTRGALAETRTLILELKPTKLLETDLSDLLKQLAESIWSRKQLSLRMSLSADVDVPMRVKVAFYRIAQEAFHNIVKHSRANTVEINYRHKDSVALLEILDDGIGFEIHNSQGLGLYNMSQRAKNIRAIFDIQSSLKNGTSIQIRWQDMESTEDDD